MNSSPRGTVEPTQGSARRIVDDAWEELRRSWFAQEQLDLPLSRLPDFSEAEARRRSGVGRELLARIEKIDTSHLPTDLVLSLRLVAFRAQMWAKEADWYWTVVDPAGVGFFGMFLPTAYCGGFVLSAINSQLKAFRFTEPGDLDRYLALVADYARLVDQIASRTQGQSDRGMRIPKAQVHQSRALLAAFRSQCSNVLAVDRARCDGLATSKFFAELDRRVRETVEPAFDRALAVLSEEYFARAPDHVGLGQYSQGGEIYNELVKLHTTLDLTPQEVHSKGLERMEQIEHSIQLIREELGFKADPAGFLAQLNADPRWRASTVEEVAGVFQRYIDRLKPRFDSYFHSTPRAEHSVAALPEALQGSMTFGYYYEPGPGRPGGVYLFNGSNLTKQPLYNIGSLTYHELMPGHHLHLCSQLESMSLHRFHAFSFVNAYNEGWAEYAATLAGEIGMYEAPEERYGRLVMDAFLTCRLVVDTGMNALGWSLEQARDYMRRYCAMGEAEIMSDSLRYSCDIPGQGLAYKLGEVEIQAMRQSMQTALGARFDLRDFHAAVLRLGALPLPDLRWYIEQETQRLVAHT